MHSELSVQSSHIPRACTTAAVAEALLEDPALFSNRRLQPGSEFGHLDGVQLLLEYIDLCELYPTPWRMVKGHAFKLLGGWGGGGWVGGCV